MNFKLELPHFLLAAIKPAKLNAKIQFFCVYPFQIAYIQATSTQFQTLNTQYFQLNHISCHNFCFHSVEEIVTKKKTELTTTKQIETRVKRQVVLEDGKVVEDSGPIVETNTTEDTNKQESESVEVSCTCY